MEKQLTEREMTEILIDFLLEQLDEAVELGDKNKVVELGARIDNEIIKMNMDVIYLKTVH